MADNDNDNEVELQLQLQLNAEQEQERRLADAQRKIAASERLQKVISVLKRKEELPSETGNEIDGLVEEFLDKVEINILNLLCNNDNSDSDDYRGLDSDRDTAQEVETAIRFFPDVLSHRIEYYNEAYLYPIHLMAFAWNAEEVEEGEEAWYRCNVKTVSFVPVVARLAIELGSFEEQYRGGLLCQDSNSENVLKRLMCTHTVPERLESNREHHELADTKYLQVLIQLRQMGLLMKEDIKRYDMVSSLCFDKDFYLAEKRFRFLTEWDPTELIRRDTYGCVPLDYASYGPSIEVFRFILECGMRYFPKKKGISLLFQEDSDNDTPFQDACKDYGHEQVMMIISDTLNNPGTVPLNSADAILSAAIDGSIHLDCVYLLVRREPDILQKLLSQSLAVVTSAGSNNSNNNNNNNTKNDDGTSPCKLVENKLDSTTERKRKR
jgi:hypothetical protein